MRVSTNGRGSWRLDPLSIAASQWRDRLLWNAALLLVLALPRCAAPGRHCTTDADCAANSHCNGEINACVIDDGGLNGPPAITTTTIAEAVVGSEYGQTIAAAGGSGAYTWSVLNPLSQLSWLSIDPVSGRLSGTPRIEIQPGVPLRVQVRDASSRTDQKTFTLAVRNCGEGESMACAIAIQGACYTGTQFCRAGILSGCVLTGAPSSDLARCGSACGPCSPASDRCRFGFCHCGSGDACSGLTPTCCARDGGAGCADLQGDPDSCGNCQTFCDRDRNHVIRGCDAGICQYPCAGGYARCPPTARSCDTDITSPDNCGACGNHCFAPDGGFSTCVAGVCLGRCSPGSQLCPPNTCFALDDPNHCGNCTTQCPPPVGGRATCDRGVCGAACNPGANLCREGSLLVCRSNTDLNNCGGCGRICAVQGGTADCSTGACVRTCPSGYNLCQEGPNYVCRSNTDLNNCGGCGRVCAVQGGTADCSTGACVRSCSAGYNLCQEGSNYVCRSNSDLNNCGGCGRVCAVENGTASCEGGSCLRTCPPDYNLCQVGLNYFCFYRDDRRHCGSCDIACRPGEQCQNGQCCSLCR